MSSKTQQRQQVYTTQTFANHDEHFNDCQVDPLAAISLEHIFTTTPNSLIVTPTEEDVPSDAIPALRNPAYANLQSFLTTSLMLPSDADHFASSHPAAQLTRLTDLSPNLYVVRFCLHLHIAPRSFISDRMHKPRSLMSINRQPCSSTSRSPSSTA